MRTAYVVLAGIMLLNVVFQFVAAGTGLVELGGDGEFDPHKSGAGASHLWPLLMIIVAAVGKLGKKLIILPVVLLLLITFQYATAEEIGSIHPLVGLIIAFGAYHAFLAARSLPDRPATPPAPAPETPGTPTV
jgi:hypothetical protein